MPKPALEMLSTARRIKISFNAKKIEVKSAKSGPIIEKIKKASSALGLIQIFPCRGINNMATIDFNLKMHTGLDFPGTVQVIFVTIWPCSSLFVMLFMQPQLIANKMKKRVYLILSQY